MAKESNLKNRIQIKLDLIILDLQNHGGVSVYWFELIKRMLIDPDYLVKAIFYERKSNYFYFKILELFNLSGSTFITRKYTFRSIFYRFIPSFSFSKKIQIFHSSYLSSFISRRNFNVLTIHDLGHERGITQNGIKRFIHVFFKRIALKNSIGIICVSEFTKNELLHFYPFCINKNIKVIYNGVDECFKPKKGGFSPLLSQKYILYVGTRFGYKNFEKTVIVTKLLDNYKLVMVGGGNLTEAETSFLNLHLKDKFVHLHNVETPELNNYYNYAHCLLYLSNYEGFGIPIVEAMKSGCPFVTYNNASIPEIAKEGGVILSPFLEIDEIVKNVLSLEDLTYRNKVILDGLAVAKNYLWDKCFQETKEFHKLILFNK